MRVPNELLGEPFNLRSLKMDGFTVVESCTHQQFSKGEMLVGQHLLLFVLKGKYVANFGKEKYEIEQGEGFVIQRTHFINYEKYSTGEEQFESLMFFLTDDIVKRFLSIHITARNNEPILKPISKIIFNSSIQTFLQSVLNSFDYNIAKNSTFLEHKLFELLFNISEINPPVIHQFAQFTKAQITDLKTVMEANYKQNFTLEEFAYKAGRSLASFKRDFKNVFNTSPHQWILGKRLELVKQLIENSNIKITDACYDAGFESVAHFSRAFKKKFGCSPSSFKVEPINQIN